MSNIVFIGFKNIELTSLQISKINTATKVSVENIQLAINIFNESLEDARIGLSQLSTALRGGCYEMEDLKQFKELKYSPAKSVCRCKAYQSCFKCNLAKQSGGRLFKL